MPIHGITATYQPFSMQERMAPLQMMKEEYDKVNESLAAFSEQADQFYQFLDPDSKAIVDQYKGTLDKVAGDMSASGLKAVNRNTLNSLRRIYASDILPIQQAAQTAGTMYAQIREMQMKDPTLMVQSVPTVSELRQNPNAAPSLVSGAQLQNEGIKAALQLPGVDYQSISRFLNGDTSAIPDIDAAAQRIADAYGVSTDQAMGYITNGIMSGLGQRATSLYDAQQKADADFANKVRLLNIQTGKEAYLTNLRHKNAMEEIQERGKYKTTSSSSSSRGGSGRGGTSYINQINGVVYAKGDSERLLSAGKEANDLMNSTKARYVSFMNLDRENKIRVLRALGANVTDDSSTYDIENAMMDYENELYNYTYMEYRDKRAKNNEFFMVPNKVRRDVYTDGEDESDYEFTLKQGE